MSTNSLADSLVERLRRAFPADQAYTPADWPDDAMPAPVRHYLTHLLRHHRRQEERYLRRARTEWVRYDHPDMEQATRTYLDRLEDHMQVPQDQWTETLRTATHRTTEYLVRPVSTLTTFVFEEASSSVPVEHIQWRMRFFGPYTYLRNAVDAFAEKRDRDAFEQDEVERILRRVDERMTADYDADRWLRLLGPLFETAQHANGRPQVPFSLLRTFFEEKNASHILDRLTAHELEHSEDGISPDTLRDLIASAPAPSSTDRPDAPPVESTPEPRGDAEDNDQSPAPTPPASDDTGDEATPMWKQFQHGQNHSQRHAEPENKQPDESQPLWTQFAAGQSSSQSPSAPEEPSTSSSEPSAAPESAPTDLQSSTDSNHGPTLTALEREVFGSETAPNRAVYVRELFQGDGEAYRDILERLRRTNTWSEASQIIASDVFRANQVNIYSDAAVHFTDAVEAGFKDA